jgi:hypothetical protein
MPHATRLRPRNGILEAPPEGGARMSRPNEVISLGNSDAERHLLARESTRGSGVPGRGSRRGSRASVGGVGESTSTVVGSSDRGVT